MKQNKYIGNKAFYKSIFAITIPILLQNCITNFVNMVDNIMVGSVGTEQMSGVSIVNQLIFVFNITIFGAVSGAGIFTAQYFGKKDIEGVRNTVRFKFVVCVAVTAVFVAALMIFDEPLINLFLHDGSYDCDLGQTLLFGKTYLWIMLIGLLPSALTNVYASTLRETGETFVPMVVSFIAVGINCLFNYFLIFGTFGFPELGVAGAAIATVMARVFECVAIIWYAVAKREKYPFFQKIYRHFTIPKQLFVNILKKGMPLLVNECLWAIGMSLLSMSYSMHGLAVVAGISISSTVTNLFNMIFMAFGTSIGIVVGQLLGADQFEEAVDVDRKMIVLAVFISVIVGIVVFTVGRFFPLLYNTTQESKDFALYFIRVCACFMPIVSFMHATYFTLRSGGKVWITFLFDSVFICCINVPMAFLLYSVFHLSIWVIFPLIQAMDLLKCIFGFILIKRRAWVHNIVNQ